MTDESESTNQLSENGGDEEDILADLIKNNPIQKKSLNSSTALGLSSTFDWGGGGGENNSTNLILDVANLSSSITDDQRFINKTIVITGAGGQLGREGCRYFALRGARIAALDLSKDGLKETFDILNADRINRNVLTFDFKPYVCDVTNEEQIKEVIDSVTHRCGKIDYLWNNAGYQGKIKPLLEQSIDDFRLTMSINVTGMFIVLQAVARKMVEYQEFMETAAASSTTTSSTTTSSPASSYCCAIVNTSSVAGQRGTPCMQAYAASKAAVLALNVNAAKELAQYNIRVNCISPALIGPGFLWERQNKLHAKVGPPFFANDPEVVAQNKINSVPLQRLGSPQEVVQTVAFLLSNDASYITGSNINIDGGMAAMIRG